MEFFFFAEFVWGRGNGELRGGGEERGGGGGEPSAVWYCFFGGYDGSFSVDVGGLIYLGGWDPMLLMCIICEGCSTC